MFLRGLLSFYTETCQNSLKSYISLKRRSLSYQHYDSPHAQHQHTYCHFRPTEDKRRHFRTYSQYSTTKSNCMLFTELKLNFPKLLPTFETVSSLHGSADLQRLPVGVNEIFHNKSSHLVLVSKLK